MSRPLGIGLVGAGRFGAFCVAAFEDLPGARVVAVMDADRTRAEVIAPPGAVIHDDLETLLDDPAVDIVHIGTPPYLHGAMARRAAERGKHVFVEKPLATTLDAARAAVDTAERAGVHLSIDYGPVAEFVEHDGRVLPALIDPVSVSIGPVRSGHFGHRPYVLRHHPLHRLAIALAHSGALGSLQHFALENFASSENLPPEHWFWDPAISGGIHVEHGVHFFDLCIALAGRDPDAVSGATQLRADGRANRVSALVRFGDAMAATFYHSFNRTAATERTIIRLAFERGHATIDGWIPTRLDIEGAVQPEAVVTLWSLFGDRLRTTMPISAGGQRIVPVAAAAETPDRQNEYRLAIRAGMSDLIAAIVRDQRLTVTAKDGVRSLEIALCAS